MIGDSDADADTDRERKRRETCAPETGHIYRELDRDMGHGKRATRLRQQTRELIGYILQHTSGTMSSANIG